MLSTLVNCAGVPGPGSAASLSSEQWDHVFAINSRGSSLAVKHAIPCMINGGRGSIINISSALGIIGAPGMAAYSASKGAIRAFTKSIAVEYAKAGIRANSIHPGSIDTPMLNALIDGADDAETFRAAMASAQPLGNIGTPEDIAWGCVYLASDEAKYVTGAELVIDGGLIAQ